MIHNLLFILTCLCLAYLSGARSGLLFFWMMSLLFIRYYPLPTYGLGVMFLVLLVFSVKIMTEGSYGDIWGEGDTLR